MSTFDYESLRDRVDAIILRFGQTAAIRRATDASADDWDASVSTADHACKAVVVDYANREVNGTEILRGDRRAFVAAGGLAVDPTPADRLIWHGAVYKIMSANPVQPAEVVVAWELQVRR